VTRRTTGRVVAAGLLLLLTACAAVDGERARDGIEYRPADDVERLGSAPLDSDDIGLVSDFELVADTLFLLDRIGRVLVAHRRDTAWHVVHSFGRRGGGPGEFTMPTGISVDSASILVIDGTRLQSFTHDGTVLDTRLLDLPCPMLLSGVHRAAAGLFVYGNCMRGSFVTDTLKAVLAWSRDTTWQLVTDDLRVTRDGSAGNIFTASSAFTPGPNGSHLFGSGADNCVWRITETAAAPLTERVCPAALDLYSTDPPPEVEARLRAGQVGGVRMEWPRTLPAYVERVAAGDGIVLVRPYGPDSVVVQRGAPSRDDIAVAPLDGLVGCKAAGCVWVLEDVAAVRLIVLDSAALARRVNALLQ
jgi:hypothetical protein